MFNFQTDMSGFIERSGLIQAEAFIQIAFDNDVMISAKD